MSNSLPEGYRAIHVKDGVLTVVMDFSQMCKMSEPFINYKGERYKRGCLQVVPLNLASDVCSCREYELVTE